MSVNSRQKSLNLRTSFTSLDVARWFLLENSGSLPDSLSRSLQGAIRAKDVATIRRLSKEFDCPQLYDSPDQYHVVAQQFALLTKVPYPFGGGDEERKRQAIDKFLRSEKLCRIASRRLDYYGSKPDRENPLYRVLLTRARGLVDKVLGSVDSALPRIIDGCRFGPGMTICSTDSARTTPYYKLGAECWSVTDTCRPYAHLAVAQSPMWALFQGKVDWGRRTVELPWKEVTNCRITFVPKDERTFRTIAIEPFGNVMVQLGVHSYIASRLRTHAGIDIHSQEWNQKAAQLGSQNWLSVDTVSTIDLSMASDCVSPGLIRRLVRPQWVALLDDLRSKSYDLDGVEGTFSKWSSMGNGYTFALETLLFWALAQVCEEYAHSQVVALAYGDDIVVSKRASLLVLELLRYTGFQVNLDKTNVVGPFRESCGADFHSGVTVRPVFQRVFEPLVTNVFTLMNTLKAGSAFTVDDVYRQLWEGLPVRSRIYGPPSHCVDSHIHAPWWWLHKFKPTGFRYDRKLQTHRHRALVFKPTRFGGSESRKCLTWFYNSSRSDGVVSSNRYVHPRLFPLLGLIPDVRNSSEVVVTQRSRGTYRVRSVLCEVSRTVDRSFYYLATG